MQSALILEAVTWRKICLGPCYSPSACNALLLNAGVHGLQLFRVYTNCNPGLQLFRVNTKRTTGLQLIRIHINRKTGLQLFRIHTNRKTGLQVPLHQSPTALLQQLQPLQKLLRPQARL